MNSEIEHNQVLKYVCLQFIHIALLNGFWSFFTLVWMAFVSGLIPKHVSYTNRYIYQQVLFWMFQNMFHIPTSFVLNVMLYLASLKLSRLAGWPAVWWKTSLILDFAFELSVSKLENINFLRGLEPQILLTNPKSKSKVQVQVQTDDWVFIKIRFSNHPATQPPTRKSFK